MDRFAFLIEGTSYVLTGFSVGRGPKGLGALGSLGRGRDFKLTLLTKIKKVSSVKMLRHIIFHKRCLKCLKLPVQDTNICTFLNILCIYIIIYTIGKGKLVLS